MNARRDYEPGTVAVATVRGVKGVRVMRTTHGSLSSYGWVSDAIAGGTRHHPLHRVTDVRPLVVLDLDGSPEPATLLRFIGRMLADGRSGYERESQWLAGLAEQIETQTKPARPAEPTGLGAVVRGLGGRKFVRVCSRHPGDDGYDWRADGALGSDSSNRAWRDIDAVEVLHEGHQSGWYDRGGAIQRGATS